MKDSSENRDLKEKLYKVLSWLDSHNFWVLLVIATFYNLLFLKGVKSIDYALINELLKSRLLSFWFRKLLVNFSNLTFIISNLASLIFITLFYFITKEMFNDKRVSFYSSLMVLISPIYMFLFSSVNHFFFFTILFLIGFLLKQKKRNILASIFLILSSFNYGFLISSIFLILYFDFRKRNKGIIVFDTVLFAVYSYYVYFRKFFDLKLTFFPIVSITEILFELSHFLSIRLIVFILAILAFIVLGYKKEFKYFDVLVIMLVILSLALAKYSKYSLILGSVFLNMSTGVSIKYILESKYSNKIFKVLTITLLLLLIIFPQPILVVKSLERAESFKETMSIINSKVNLSQKNIVAPKDVCLINVLGGNIAFFDNNMCSGFYYQDTDYVLRVLESQNKTSLLQQVIVEDNKPSEKSLSEFKEFLSIIDSYEFKKRIKEYNISGIILTKSFEEYLSRENSVLLTIIKSYQIKEPKENYDFISFGS